MTWSVRLPQRQAPALLFVLTAFAAVTAARFAVAAPGAAVGYLFVLPITFVATRFGRGAGAGAGAVALLITGVWARARGIEIGFIGYTVRALMFVGVGTTVATLVHQRDAYEHEARRWFSMSNDLLCTASLDGRFTRVNAAWTALLGYTEDELLERPFADFVHPDDRDRTASVAAGLAEPSVVADFENRYRAKDGSWHWLLWSSRSDGRQIYAVAKDITQRKRLEAERDELIRNLRAAARTDELTGLANRRAWNERLVLETRRCNRTGEPLSVAILDLDDFKLVNDTKGHPAGDRLLREVTAAWQGALRETDLLGRLGGDEFGVILPGCPEAEHDAVVARLQGAMPPGAAASIGLAEWHPDTSLGQLVAQADRALYAAKFRGRAERATSAR